MPRHSFPHRGYRRRLQNRPGRPSRDQGGGRISPSRRVKIGDWVIVHAGFAISKLDEADAEETLGLLREMAESGSPRSAADMTKTDLPRQERDGRPVARDVALQPRLRPRLPDHGSLRHPYHGHPPHGLRAELEEAGMDWSPGRAARSASPPTTSTRRPRSPVGPEHLILATFGDMTRVPPARARCRAPPRHGYPGRGGLLARRIARPGPAESG